MIIVPTPQFGQQLIIAVLLSADAATRLSLFPEEIPADVEPLNPSLTQALMNYFDLLRLETQLFPNTVIVELLFADAFFSLTQLFLPGFELFLRIVQVFDHQANLFLP